MTVDIFINEVLAKNFGPDDKVVVGLNKKHVNKKTGATFSRDFSETHIRLKALKTYLGSVRKVADVYVCMNPVKDCKRTLENAQESYLIGMDIDGVDVPTDEYAPSYYWETSPKKFQGVWIFDNPLPVDKQAKICRALVNRYGFDPTSADIVHYYRVPQTVNHKYKTDFKVSELQGTGKVYRVKEFKDLVKNTKVTVAEEAVKGPIKTRRFDLDEILDKYNLHDIYDFTIGTDRSDYCFALERSMFTQGASKEEVKFILLNVPPTMAKYKTDREVDAEVHRVFEKCEPDPNKRGDDMASLKSLHKHKKHVVQDKDISIKLVKDIEDYDDTDAWLIEDFWANNSVGIIGAPSKSFKSTLTTNMAVAVASGGYLDGHKAVQGSVLVVQGENNISMEKMKIYSIAGDVDLPIYYAENIITLDQIHRLIPVIKKYEIKLLIIDPMYLLFGAGDINKHNDVASRLKALTDLRNETGCSVILVHHSRKIEKGSQLTTQDMYGSTFIEGWYESMILMQRKGPMTSKVTTYFRNHRSGDSYYMNVDDNMGIKLIPINDDREAAFSSLKPKKGKEEE